MKVFLVGLNVEKLKDPISNSDIKKAYEGWLKTVCLILCALIFIIDLQTPLGIADGISYVAVVLLTIWISDRRYVYLFTVLGIGLTIAGFFFSPRGENMGIVIPNRLLAIIGIIAAAIIILAYKKSQEQMMKSKEQLESLFQNANEGIVIFNSQLKTVKANPSASIMFGYSSADFCSKSINQIIPDFSISPLSSKDLDGIKSNSDKFPIEISLSNYKTSEGLFHVAFITDIAERKKQEQELQVAHHNLQLSTDELKRSNAELENFAYISSHDLQEPLRKIQSFGSRLKDLESDKLGEQSSDYLNRMLNASSRMQNLINDLLLFSRVSSQTKPFTKINLQEILSDVKSDMEVTIDQNNAQIESLLSAVTIEAEPTQMRQLFQNLLTNAIKFRKEDVEPKIKIRDEIFTLPDNKDKKYLTIYFEDNGIGFDQKYSDRIFNIFQRLEGTKFPGSGIGLTICRKIVQRHGGFITVKSEVGKGATFIITLPFLQQEPLTEEFISRMYNHEKQTN